MYTYILVFLFYIFSINALHLNKHSQQQIKYIIQHPGITQEMRTKINTVLFNSYKDWATRKAINFKYLHNRKCYHIKNDEIISYALFGLYQGIERYNGNNTFITYIDLYIKHQLQQCTTKLIPINALPKTYLRKKRTIEENNKLYNIYLKPIYIDSDNYLIENTIYNSIYSHNTKWLNDEDNLLFQIKIWEKIRSLSPFQMIIMYYKYSSNFDLLRTNGAIADIMHCSTQTVRMNLIDIKHKLLPFISENCINFNQKEKK
jgi:hypothetical protein